MGTYHGIPQNWAVSAVQLRKSPPSEGADVVVNQEMQTSSSPDATSWMYIGVVLDLPPSGPLIVRLMLPPSTTFFI